jgi:hypothetical protein
LLSALFQQDLRFLNAPFEKGNSAKKLIGSCHKEAIVSGVTEAQSVMKPLLSLFQSSAPHGNMTDQEAGIAKGKSHLFSRRRSSLLKAYGQCFFCQGICKKILASDDVDLSQIPERALEGRGMILLPQTRQGFLAAVLASLPITEPS